jgi:hypothetical protein
MPALPTIAFVVTAQLPRRVRVTKCELERALRSMLPDPKTAFPGVVRWHVRRPADWRIR